MEKNKKHKWSRTDINLLLEHSSLQADQLDDLLQEECYANSKLYQRVSVLSLAVFGIGFFVIGVLFFFAYNWDTLSKTVKMGIPTVLLIGFVLLALLTKWELLYKKLLLLGASMLIGVLFAVFGQVYQTGANAYDLFLSWLLAISVWTFISNFPWQWLLYVVLANTTLVLYYVQVHSLENGFLFGIFITLLNLLLLVLPILANRKWKQIEVPSWYALLLELTLITILSLGCIFRIFDDFNANGKVNYYSLVFVVLSCLLFGGGYLYGYRKKQLFLVAAIPFALLIITAFFLGNFMLTTALGYLIIGLFAVFGSTILIIKLNKLQKEWKHGVE